MSPATIARLKPYLVQVEKGKSYFWCACGLSKKQPFCDGSHKVTEFLPLKWVAEQTGEKLLCACKQTRAQPFCDGSHNSLSDTYAEADEADGDGAKLVDYVPGEGGALKAKLDNGCYVIRVPESAMSAVGTMKIYPVIGEVDGAKIWKHVQAAGEPDGLVVSSLRSVQIRRIEAGILDGLVGGDQGVQGEGVEAARGLAVKIVEGVEAFQLASERGGVGLRVEIGNRSSATVSAHHGVPEGLDGQAERSQGSHACDDNPGLTVRHESRGFFQRGL